MIMGRDDRLHQEAESLWRALTGEPPPRGLHGESLLEAALRLKPTVAYDRLHSPWLRPTQITRPK
jgi:DNA anti-recombination protein RmuC